MKRTMALLLALLMLLTSAAPAAFAVETESGETQTSEITAVDPELLEELPGNDDLFAGYVDQAFFGGFQMFGTMAREMLNEQEKQVYDILKQRLEDIAANGGRTVIEVDVSGISGLKYEYSYGTNVYAKYVEQVDSARLMTALLYDCAYELYWFDKTSGMSTVVYSSYLGQKSWITAVEYEFTVAKNYRSGNNDTVVTDNVAKVRKAVDTAEAIVEAHKDKSDYKKLVAYRDEICSRVSYNYDAAYGTTVPFSVNNDPWQLIYVLDGDSSTNVVCEGYAKAFQYLCDLSDLKDAECYLVTGAMDGENHMWNVVTMEDGSNYLVDVTNSDAGTVGANGGLFLAGYDSGSARYGYYVNGVLYQYYTNLFDTYPEYRLTLSKYDYIPPIVWHSFTNYISNNDATCMEDGTKTAWCDFGCGTTDTVADEGSKLDHKFTDYVSDNDATCTADGHKTAACDYNCGETDTVADEGSRRDHKFTDYVSDDDATCTADGHKTAACDHGCGTTDTVADEGGRPDHKFTNYVSDNNATCMEDGTETALCDYGCGTPDTRADEGSVDPEKHSFTNYVSNNDATCMEDGTETALCDYGCGTPDTRADEGSADPEKHSFTDYVSDNDATCTADGHKTASCDYNCGETDTVADEGSRLDHKFTDYVSDNNATCMEDGTETALCDYGCDTPDTRADEGSVDPEKHSFTDYVFNNDAEVGVNGTETALCDYGCGTPDTREAEGTALPAVEGANRIYGNSRYETSFSIANEYKSVLEAEKFENIIVASGENFPDALAGSYLAAVKNAPIIMAKVKNGQLKNGAELKAYISENLADGGTVYVLGGNSAIPYTLDTELAGLPLTRLEGRSRYDTNLLILNTAGITGDTLLVCTGKGYADALSASASGLPILLVDGEGSLKDAQKEFLEQHGFSNIYILGGTQAVNAGFDSALAGYAGTVTRLAGSSRRATSVLVAETFFEHPTAAVIAYSDNFPDGLCGGPLAHALGAPVILTKSSASTVARTYMQQQGISDGYVLGGSGLVSDEVVNSILGIDTAR